MTEENETQVKTEVEKTETEKPVETTTETKEEVVEKKEEPETPKEEEKEEPKEEVKEEPSTETTEVKTDEVVKTEEDEVRKPIYRKSGDDLEQWELDDLLVYGKAFRDSKTGFRIDPDRVTFNEATGQYQYIDEPDW